MIVAQAVSVTAGHGPSLTFPVPALVTPHHARTHRPSLPNLVVWEEGSHICGECEEMAQGLAFPGML